MNDRVLIDTNVWISAPMLNTNLGEALLHRLKGNPHSIVFPDVVREEVIKHVRRLASEKKDTIDSAYEALGSLLGNKFAHDLPSTDEVQASLHKRFSELGPYLFPVSMTLSHAQLAQRRVLDDRAPSAPKNQQFKDCVIWEIALDEAAHGPLHFVTDDRTFYEGQDKKQGMAKILRDDCTARGVSIYLHNGLKELLTKLQEQPQLLDETKFEATILPELQRHLIDFAQQQRFSLGAVIERRFTAFPTAQYGEVAVSFSFVLGVTDLSLAENETSNGDELHVTGSERFNFLHGTGQHAMIDRIDYMKGGTNRVIQKSAQFLYAGNVQPSAILGSFTVPTFRSEMAAVAGSYSPV